MIFLLYNKLPTYTMHFSVNNLPIYSLPLLRDLYARPLQFRLPYDPSCLYTGIALFHGAYLLRHTTFQYLRVDIFKISAIISI